jgi:hypothetical protein
VLNPVSISVIILYRLKPQHNPSTILKSKIINLVIIYLPVSNMDYR